MDDSVYRLEDLKAKVVAYVLRGWPGEEQAHLLSPNAKEEWRLSLLHWCGKSELLRACGISAEECFKVWRDNVSVRFV